MASRNFRKVVKNVFSTKPRAPALNFDFLDDDKMSVLEKDFHAACTRYYLIQSKLSNEEGLDIYALYKQATKGDCNIVRPNPLFRRRLYRYLAWRSRQGMSSYEATVRYVDAIKRLDSSIQHKKSLNDKSGSSLQKKKSSINQLARSLNRKKNPKEELNHDEDTLEALEKNFTLGANKYVMDINRASAELHAFLSSNDSSRNKGAAYSIGDDDSDEALNYKGKAVEPTNIYSSANKKFGTAQGQQRSSARTLRDQYKVTEEEYKRFTMMKYSSAAFETKYSARGESMISFGRSSFVYQGPTFKSILKAAKNDGDRFRDQSNLFSSKKVEQNYNEVIIVIHLAAAELKEKQQTINQDDGKDDFSGTAITTPVDTFLFRLVRYLDKWFREDGLVNGVGCRSVVITLIYISRLEKSLGNFKLTNRNTHNLLSVCMLLAAKFSEDKIISNEYWSRVAGIGMAELNHIEEVFCSTTNFMLDVLDDELEREFKRFYVRKVKEDKLM